MRFARLSEGKSVFSSNRSFKRKQKGRRGHKVRVCSLGITGSFWTDESSY